MADAAPRMPRALTVVALVLGLALAALSIGTSAALRLDWDDFVSSYSLTNLVVGVGFLLSGVAICWFRPGNAVGWLFLLGGYGHLLTTSAGLTAFYGSDHDWPPMLTRALATVFLTAWQLGLGGLFPLAVLLFPDGHLPSRRWLPLAVLVVLTCGYSIVTTALAEGDTGVIPQSIFAVGFVAPPLLAALAGILSALILPAAIVSLIVRFARGDERTRRQLLWLILAVIALFLINAQRWITGDGPILLLLSFVLVPIAIAIAIVRYQLLDIRFVLSRTLLYGLAIAALVAAYAALVAGLSLLVPADANRAVAVVAAVVVALGFNPLLVILRSLVNRAFYGTRSDPAATAASLGESFREENDLDGVIDGARAALRLPYLALEPASGRSSVISGERPADTVELPLAYRNDTVGTLSVGLRSGDRALHQDDRRTLDLIASPLALALHALALTEQVQSARTAIVEAREQERVRLQRDLHDGLGPVLTSVALRADAASNLLRTDLDEAERILAGIRADVRGALEDVRRVVHGLRPIELDELGLVAALRQRIPALTTIGDRNVELSISAPEMLPPLTAAVELAAFRIVTESVANVLKHSDGRHCAVTVGADPDWLELEVDDDGTPNSDWNPGVGALSIAERADELGGTSSVGPTATGWRVTARLPLAASG